MEADGRGNAGGAECAECAECVERAAIALICFAFYTPPAVFQQFCGINVEFNYTPRIFSSIGVPQDGQLLQAVFIGVSK